MHALCCRAVPTARSMPMTCNARVPRAPVSTPTGGGSNLPNPISAAPPSPTQRRADLLAAWRHSTGHAPDGSMAVSSPPSGAASSGQVLPDAFSSGGAGSITLNVRGVGGGGDGDNESTYFSQFKDGLPHGAQAKPRVAWPSGNGGSGVGPGPRARRDGVTDDKAAAGPEATAGSRAVSDGMSMSLPAPTAVPAEVALTAEGGQLKKSGSWTQQRSAALAAGSGAAATDGGGASNASNAGAHANAQDTTSPRARYFSPSFPIREASAPAGEAPVVSGLAFSLPSSAHSPVPFRGGPHPTLAARPSLRALSTLAPAHIAAAAAAAGPTASGPTGHASFQLMLPHTANASADAGLCRAASATTLPSAIRHQSLSNGPVTPDAPFEASCGMPRPLMQGSGSHSGLRSLRRTHTFHMGPAMRTRGGGDGSAPARVDLRAAVLSSSFSVSARPRVGGGSSPHLDGPTAVAAALDTPGGGSDRSSGIATPSRSGPIVPAGGTGSGGVPFLLGASPTPGSSAYSSKMHRAAQMLQRMHGVAMDPSTGTVLVGGEAPRTELPVPLLSLPPPPPAPPLPSAPAASDCTPTTAATDQVFGSIVATGPDAGMVPDGRVASDSRCEVLGGGGGGGGGLRGLSRSGSIRLAPHLSSAPSPHVAAVTATATGPTNAAAAANSVVSVEPRGRSLRGAAVALPPPEAAVAAGPGVAAATTTAALGGAAMPQAATIAQTAERTGAMRAQVGCVAQQDHRRAMAWRQTCPSRIPRALMT